MRSLKSVLILCSALLLLVSLVTRAAADDTVKILVVFPQQLEPSKVYMVTDGQLTRGLLIPFAAIANNMHLQKRSEELGQQLDQALSGYDRYGVIFQSLVNKFEHRSPMFALSQTRDIAKFVAGEGVSAEAGSQGYGYVILIEDKFSGLSMLNQLATKTDDVAPLTTLGYRVYETKKRSRVAKGNITANGLQKKPFRQAVTDKEFFVTTYPTIADILANQLVGSLFQTDVLHAMAASIGRGAEVPQIASVLKKHERRFSYALTPAKDWKRTKMTTKYANLLEPKGDLRFSMGLRFDIDLLVPEFGQAVSTVDDYLQAYLGRLADSGIDVSTFAEFKDITVPDSYRVFSFQQNKDGGRQIVLMRMLNSEMIEVVWMVILKDFDTLFPKHRAELEEMIASARLITQ